MPFPLPFVPALDYHKPSRATMHARWFGATRDGGRRLHAGCDLVVALGTPVIAIDDGVITEVSKRFYLDTSAIAVQHKSGFVARYCELLQESIAGLREGQFVKSGQVVAKVGKMRVDSMLHFELYSGECTGRLSTHRPPSAYHRRADLLNPTAMLDSLRGLHCAVLV